MNKSQDVTRVGVNELVRSLRNARRRLRYWQTVSPCNTRKSRGEGMEMAKADIEQLTYFLSLSKIAIECRDTTK